MPWKKAPPAIKTITGLGVDTSCQSGPDDWGGGLRDWVRTSRRKVSLLWMVSECVCLWHSHSDVTVIRWHGHGKRHSKHRHRHTQTDAHKHFPTFANQLESAVRAG